MWLNLEEKPDLCISEGSNPVSILSSSVSSSISSGAKREATNETRADAIHTETMGYAGMSIYKLNRQERSDADVLSMSRLPST